MNEFDIVVNLFIDWSSDILRPPYLGSIYDTYHCFLNTIPTLTLPAFIDSIIRINKLSHSIYTNKGDLTTPHIDKLELYDMRFTWIDKLSLLLLSHALQGMEIPVQHPIPRDLLQILNCSITTTTDTDLYSCTTRSSQLEQLDSLIHSESARLKLYREKLHLTTRRESYFPICHSRQHATLASSLLAPQDPPSEIENMAKRATNSTQLEMIEDLSRCLRNKIHYVPLITPHTDPKLGDCSYLDTCHKMASCRYVHYRQLILPKEDAESHRHNREIARNKQISDFTWGEPIGDLMRNELPAQWINCDIRKLDFAILGKFAAVIADPPWNIHMNLPYGTCNDSELLALPMEQLQDSGILLLWVTGRSIELGRQSFIRWGYRIVDELIWVKTNQLMRTICTGRTGHWLNHSKEHLLIGFMVSWRDWSVPSHVNWRYLDVTITRDPVGSVSYYTVYTHREPYLTSFAAIGNQLQGVRILEQDVAMRYAAAANSSQSESMKCQKN